MKYFIIICAALLLLGIVNLPIGYYTFLRIAVTIGAIMVVVIEYRNGINFRVLAFGLIAILFNPLIPVYFNDKGIWTIIDLITAVLFVVEFFRLKKNASL